MSRMKDLLGDTPFETYGGMAPFEKHSVTSFKAAVSVTPQLGKLQQIVLDFLRQHRAANTTDEAMMDALNLGGNTLRPRRCELVKRGLVYDSGKTAPTRSGREAVVWRAR